MRLWAAAISDSLSPAAHSRSHPLGLARLFFGGGHAQYAVDIQTIRHSTSLPVAPASLDLKIANQQVLRALIVTLKDLDIHARLARKLVCSARACDGKGVLR